MSKRLSRRHVLATGIGGAAISLNGLSRRTAKAASADTSKLPFKLSLAQWSLHNSLFGRTDLKIDNLDFATVARILGIEGLEYVNQFFTDKAKDQAYLDEMQKRAADNGCRAVLIMCDREGNLGEPEKARRIQAVENHYKWLEAAKFFGCHSIRVNAHSRGTFEEQQKLVADGLARLCERAKQYDLNAIVENHGGLSSNGQWLVGVMKRVDMPNCGTLPDFGNFREYDRYKGVKELMPYAKGVSAKAGRFDDEGNEVNTDYARMMKIVLDAGYRGYVGIESSVGDQMSELEAILMTKHLLQRVAKGLAGNRGRGSDVVVIA
jgi:sugar phosphate isomerase/epimerase